jgi:hypothetical protein
MLGVSFFDRFVRHWPPPRMVGSRSPGLLGRKIAQNCLLTPAPTCRILTISQSVTFGHVRKGETGGNERASGARKSQAS